jgi:TrmH family RNA methyltransferase
MITSVHNPKIKWVRSLQAENRTRREEQAFVVEGVRLAEEALASKQEARLILYTEDLGERGVAVLDGFMEQGVSAEQVTNRVMQAASDTETPQGILAILELRELSIPDRLDFVLIPDMVRDPGNLGTMLRTAAAAGIQVVFIPPETADPLSPKVVRSGMGAHFRLPIRLASWEEIEQKTRSLNIYLAAANQGLLYTQADLRNPLALIVGGEASGASAKARNLAIARLHIPMPGGCDSLNAAVAAGILLFEAARQRSGIIL